jgi:hypothetical protein
MEDHGKPSMHLGCHAQPPSWLSCFLTPNCIQLGIPSAFPAIELVLGWVLLVVILMVLFGRIELGSFSLACDVAEHQRS